MSNYRIVIAGGGTGGHVYPVLAVIDALIKKMGEVGITGAEIIRVGPADGYDTLFENKGVKISHIAAGKLRRYASIGNLIDIPKLFVGFLQALVKLYVVMPDIIFSKGGTGALPVVIAGWFYRIPIVIHESDAVPGNTNRVSARFAKKVFVSFPSAASYFDAKKTEASGTPIRKELFADRTTKPLAKESIGFDPSSPLVLVMGGSQGSQRINHFILENLPVLIKEAQILHQTGVANLAESQKLARAAVIDESYRNRYQATGYFDKNLSVALTAADLVITRSGSGALAEISAFGIPAILIPLAESANGHQLANAVEFARGGGGIVIEEVNLLPGIFIGQLKTILGDEGVRTKMAEASGQFFIPGAAEKIADEILHLSV